MRSLMLLALAGAACVAIAGASVEQTSQGSRPALAVLESFDGLGAGMAAGPGANDPPAPRNPSDNSLAVGPSHIFQIVNSQLAIFTKKGAGYDTTGRTLYGPVSTNTIFAGFGGVCEARPNGDAVVRYDQLAGRWLVVMPIFHRTVFDQDQIGARPAREAGRGGAAGTGGSSRSATGASGCAAGTGGAAATLRWHVRDVLCRERR